MIHRVLIIDDSAEALDLVEAILSPAGYEILRASNGEDGLKLVRKHNPSLIIVDVLMPGMDGFVFLKELKKDKSFSGIPVIILTARAKMEDTFKALGVESFISKPIQADSLLSQVKKYVSFVRSEMAAQATQEKMKTPQQQTSGGDSIEEASNRILIFGSQETVMSKMFDQLKELNCHVTILNEEARLVALAEEIVPTLVLLQIGTETEKPMDEIVINLDNILRYKIDAYPEKGEYSKIVLYRVEPEDAGEKSMGAEIADLEYLIDRCYQNGATKYIGGYSSISFLLKIKQFLN